MRAYDIIYKKRQGYSLSREEIEFLINGYSSGKIPDYQISAWAMAVFFQGMDDQETAYLTEAMARSGEIVDLSEIGAKVIDKHSTGGVGDKTSLVLGPLVSAAGIPVAKMSGRGLGHTGGTIDKLESIPGFCTEISSKEFLDNVRSTGISIIAQTADIAPADKKLYALRDLTATVESIPLIASSIMSKKIAGGADGIVLDVKTGNGAFMENLEEARELAEKMVRIGRNVGRKTIAVISDMNQPLGYKVGNTLEVEEAVECLRGKGPEDLRELCLTLGANMLILAEKAADFRTGYEELTDLLDSGKAYEKFLDFVAAQGGDIELIKNDDLSKADKRIMIEAEDSGFVSSIKTREIGLCAMLLGAGRDNKESKIDYEVGLELKKKIGDRVNAGEPLVEVYYNKEDRLDEVIRRLKDAFIIKKEKQEPLILIYEIIE
ncbi:MAG: pyrimidine-nucleoside phosphorylase [Halanaerobiaceae bacterium]|nr:pyrimidine-nucleoside phosphorylase [Halanaerobiaceae bacterium]